jgi:hypothetical protein
MDINTKPILHETKNLSAVVQIRLLQSQPKPIFNTDAHRLEKIKETIRKNILLLSCFYQCASLLKPLLV